VDGLAFELIGEGVLRDTVETFVRAVEAAGAVVIVVGATVAFIRFIVVGLRQRDAHAFVRIRLSFGRFLVLGLEFQLAADILKTAVSPSFTELGQLAVVAAIRTVLNYVLTREIKDEQAQVDEQDRSASSASEPGRELDRP